MEKEIELQKKTSMQTDIVLKNFWDYYNKIGAHRQQIASHLYTSCSSGHFHLRADKQRYCTHHCMQE